MADKPTNTKRQTTLRMFAVAAVVYFLWLTWLAYVAWVNTQAGNQ